MLKDMTVGNPSKILLKFAWPMILSGIFQQLYNIVDSIVAGKYAGVNALAAVGASYPITMLFIAVAIGGSMGCSVIISHLFGAKQFPQLKTSIYTGIISMTAIGIIIMVACIFLCDPLMRLMNTPANIFDDSALYLRIYIFGLVFLFVYNIANAVFTGLGDSIRPLIFLIISSVSNIILDYIFVKYLHWGVAGVAWATFIAQGASSIVAITAAFIKIRSIKAEKGSYKYYSFPMLKKMSRVAVPSIIQFSIISVGQLCIQGLVNSFGSVVIAGYSAGIKIDSFMKMPLINLGQAYSNYTAQNMGAGKVERVKQGYKATLILAIIIAVIFFVISKIFGSDIIGFFVSSTGGPDTANIAGVIEVGVQYLTCVTIAYPIFALLITNNNILRGCAYMVPFTVSTLADLSVRVCSAYVLASFMGSSAIWVSIPISWAVCVAITTPVYIKGNWQNRFSPAKQ